MTCFKFHDFSKAKLLGFSGQLLNCHALGVIGRWINLAQSAGSCSLPDRQTPSSLNPIWELPKIGDPKRNTLHSRILIIRTPEIRYPPIVGNSLKSKSTRPLRRSSALHLKECSQMLRERLGLHSCLV